MDCNCAVSTSLKKRTAPNINRKPTKFAEICGKLTENCGFWPRSEDLFLFGRSPLDTKFVDRQEDGSKLYIFILVRGKRDKRLRIAGRVVTLRNKMPSDIEGFGTKND